LRSSSGRSGLDFILGGNSCGRSQTDRNEDMPAILPNFVDLPGSHAQGMSLLLLAIDG
jgi:hypothetical protein